MIISWIWTLMVAISILISVIFNKGSALAAAVLQGAQSGVTLTVAMAGSICLWSGAGKLMEQAGLTRILSGLLSPVLHRIFPATKSDHVLAGHLSSNICANVLGLGNAATPMGIAAAKRMRSPEQPGRATDELCRLIVLNTASIQLIPSNVAAVRLSLGCASPFDILPAVWVTSLASASLGLAAACLLGKVWNHD